MHRDQLPIPEPCDASWDAMSGDEERRFCGQCSKNVHDLSAVTEDEARAVLQEPGVCVRYTVGRNGQIRFRTRRAFLAGAAASMIALPAAASTASSAEEPGLLDWLLERAAAFFSDEDPATETLEVLAGEPVMVKPPPPPQVELDAPVMGGIGPAPEPVEEILMGDIALEPEPEPEPPRRYLGKPRVPDPQPAPEPQAPPEVPKTTASQETAQPQKTPRPLKTMGRLRRPYLD